LSRTDILPNPHPLVVVWGGPVFGSLFPLGAWALAKVFGAPHLFLWRFFAGFCLVANGIDLVGASWLRDIDPGILIALGVPRAVLVAWA
jgi:hypothetical protein